jgi:acyl-CoA synthetase (AMP-forming)/AMP-acid ligase II
MRPPFYELTLIKGEYLPADFPAIIWGNKKVTWKVLKERINRLANGLKDMGLKKGELCAFVFYNRPEFVETSLAIQALGAVPVPINYRYVKGEMEYVLNNCEAKFLIFDEDLTEIIDSVRKNVPSVKCYICKGKGLPWAEEYESLIGGSDKKEIKTDVTYDDPMVIIYTGGTTGMPKGVILTYGNIHANQDSIAGYLIHLLPKLESKGKSTSSLEKKVQAVGKDLFTAVQKIYSSKSLENKVILIHIEKEKGVQFPPITVLKENGEIKLFSSAHPNPDIEMRVKIKETLREFFNLEIYSSTLKGKMKLLPILLKKQFKKEIETKAKFPLKLAIVKANLSSHIPSPNYLLIVPPMFHLASFAVWLNHWNYPFGSIIFPSQKSFDPFEILEIIDLYKVNEVFMVPTMWKRVIESLSVKFYDTSSVKIALSGAAVLHADVKKEILSKFPNALLIDAFGQTEMAPVTTVRVDADEETLKERCVGKPVPGVEIKIVDEYGNELPPGEIGEIWYRSESLMKGYLKDEKKTKEVILEDGWFKSGDLGYMGKNGEIYIVERKSECINTGGEKVYPGEVEEVIARHPKVAQVCVVGVPDETWGEIVGALVVLKEGESCSEEEIIKWCEGKIAGYKKPKIVKFVKELPVSPVGKVQRKMARELFKE